MAYIKLLIEHVTLLQTNNVINNPNHQPEKAKLIPPYQLGNMGRSYWRITILAALTFKMAGKIDNSNKS